MLATSEDTFLFALEGLKSGNKNPYNIDD